MSVSSQLVMESGNWKPTAYEIAELLLSLGISPPQSLDENLFPTSTDSCGNSTSLGFTDFEESGGPDNGSCSATPTGGEIFDRETAIEQLRVVIEDGKFIKCRNNYFHEHLVEHFNRKQMMHVYTDESEDDVLLNDYLRKLDELERSNEELRKSREEWDAELSRTQARIRMKKEETRGAIQEMISKERAVGESTSSCGKPLGLNRVHALITRQLDRMRDIAKFRLRYTRLRDELISRQVELSSIMLSSPNLTKDDYERLEAEQFYYKRELKSKENQHESLMKRRKSLVNRVERTRRKIMEISGEIDECEDAIEALRDTMKVTIREKKISLMKLMDARRFIREFDEVIGQSTTPKFTSAIDKIRNEHEDWIRKISKTLTDIKNLSQSLNAARANLIIHGKYLDESAIGSEIKSQSPSPISHSDEICNNDKIIDSNELAI